MEFCIFTEPQQGADYAMQLAHARAAEGLGFTGWFRSDHYLAMGSAAGLPGPTDAWTTLAGLARETDRIRLGTLVSSATFRHPGVLAVQVAQVDAMSGGRVELGLGTGWFEAEHAALGIPFPSRRFDLLEEQLQILTGYWSTPQGERFSFDGQRYRLEDAPALPKPLQHPVPLIVGGLGPSRTPALAARFATEYNASFADEAGLAAAFDRLREAQERVGRPRHEVQRSVAQQTVVGRTDAEFLERSTRAGADPDELRGVHLGGTPSAVRDRVAAYEAMGVGRVYLQTIDMTDFAHLDLLAETLLD